MTEIKEINTAKITPDQALYRQRADGRLEVFDAQRDRYIKIPQRPMTRVRADVSERWVANVIIPERLCRHIVEAPFLEPRLYQGTPVLSLCAIFMRHAAPHWAPLKLGPSSHNCALRVACTDKRDGSDAVWVDYRYTDSVYAQVLKHLGFPAVLPFLELHRWGGQEGQQGMRLDCTTAQIDLAIDSGHQPRRFALFKEADAFADYFNAGVRSYGPGFADDFAVVDLHKRGQPMYKNLQDWRGVLTTPMGRWHCDSIYQTTDQIYEWDFQGYCDYGGVMLR